MWNVNSVNDNFPHLLLFWVKNLSISVIKRWNYMNQSQRELRLRNEAKHNSVKCWKLLLCVNFPWMWILWPYQYYSAPEIFVIFPQNHHFYCLSLAVKFIFHSKCDCSKTKHHQTHFPRKKVAPIFSHCRAAAWLTPGAFTTTRDRKMTPANRWFGSPPTPTPPLPLFSWYHHNLDGWSPSATDE